jgi:alpha-D-xyloside xylohydrolase
MKPGKFVVAVIAGLSLMNHSVQAAGMEDLTVADKPLQVAPGVWKISIGDLSEEVRYTDLAAEKPRMDALNNKSRVAYPFKDNPITFYRSRDNRTMVRVPAHKDESLFGFGLQLDGIKKTKKVLDLNVDHWAYGRGATHAPVPFYISSKGYGVFINTARFVKAYVQVGNRKDSPSIPKPVDRNPVENDPNAPQWDAQPDSDAVEAQIVGEGMEVLIFAGENLQDIVARYNLYCGGGTLPPLWGLGFWHRVPAKFSAAECKEELKEFEKHHIPLDVLGLEPGWMTKSYPCTFEWQKKRFPDPAAFCKGLLDKGIRLNLWENPYISPEARLYNKMYDLSGSHTVWLGIVPDYMLSEARAVLAEQHKRDHIDIGVSGYKLDEVDGYDQWLWPSHATFPSGTTGEAMRQTYGLQVQKATYEDLFRKNNQRTYGLVRSSNGAGSAYPYVLYSDSYSHKQYITGISAASLSGTLWTPEVRNAGAGEEWLNRIQTVCFSPLAQLNAWFSEKKPWSYDEVTDEVREVIELRMKLLPYLYTAFADYHFTGVPPIRAMILEQGADALKEEVQEGKLDGVFNPYEESKVVEKTDQFMFGPSILVAPFYEGLAKQRSVALPAGNWYSFYSGEFAGNNTRVVVKNDGRIPLYVKEGAVIPMLKEVVGNTEKVYGQPLEVRHYGKSAGSAELYEDDGKTFDYDRGEFGRRKLTVVKDGNGFKGSESVLESNGPEMFGPVTKWTFMTK